MTPINQTFVLNKDSDLQSFFGWDKIHVHHIYPTRIVTRREHKVDFLYRLKSILFPGEHWKNHSFKERLAIHWRHVHFFPGPKMQVYRYAATATCDGEFETWLDWDDLQEELSYSMYKPTINPTPADGEELSRVEQAEPDASSYDDASPLEKE